MLKWIRGFMNYYRHDEWLAAHFQEGGYIMARDGSSILTAIVDMLDGIDPDSVKFPDRAMAAIQTLTRPDSIWGSVVAYKAPYKTCEDQVPARLITVEAVRKHARHIRDLRANG
jgi:hypothetical protein